jgi:hypothetical protein
MATQETLYRRKRRSGKKFMRFTAKEIRENYARRTTMPLKTEQNTPAMEERVFAAFCAKHDYGEEEIDHHVPTAVFEHGQWWITTISGAIYSVVDAEGKGSVDGFDFEVIERGDDED